jgi:hypothetical protein
MDFAAVREAVVAKRNWRVFGEAHKPLLITVLSQAHIAFTGRETRAG